MAIGELLLAKNFINEDQLKKVLHQQKIAGGRIGDNLIALGYITREKLEALEALVSTLETQLEAAAAGDAPPRH